MTVLLGRGANRSGAGMRVWNCPENASGTDRRRQMDAGIAVVSAAAGTVNMRWPSSLAPDFSAVDTLVY